MAETKIKTRIYIRHDTEENWKSSSTILQEGELGYSVKTETNDNGEEVITYILKIGNGKDVWSKLPDTHIYYNKEDIDNIKSELESSISNINSTIETMKYDYDTDEHSDENKKDYVISVSEEKGIISVTKENFDTEVTEGSEKAVTGGAVNTKITETIESLNYNDTDDSEPTNKTNKYVISVSEEKGIISVIKGDIDDEVTEDSKNPITSGAVYSEVQEKISNLVNASIVVKDSYEDLVSKDGEKGIIYLVPCNHEGAGSLDTTSADTYDEYITSADTYDEYIWIDPMTDEEAVGYYEKIGNTDIDLSNYVTTEDLEKKIEEAKETLEESLESEISKVKGIIGVDDEYDVETDKTLISRISDLESTTAEQGEAISSINKTLNGGDEDSGLVKDVETLQSTVGDEDSGLVKDVADNTSSIEALDKQINGDSTDEEDTGIVGQISNIETSVEANSSDIKELQQKALTNVYLENGVLYYETLTDDTAEETP